MRLIVITVLILLLSLGTGLCETVTSSQDSVSGSNSAMTEDAAEPPEGSPQLLNLYASVNYFYDSNPAAISLRTIQVRDISPDSRGWDFYADISTRDFHPLEQLGFGLGFSWSSTFFVRQQARSLDSAAYNPYVSISYALLPNIDLSLRGDVSFNYFDRTRISNDYGGTLTATWYSEGGQSLNIHGGLKKERFSDRFNDKAGGSLRYQDAWNRSIGAGGYLLEPESGISLNLDYPVPAPRTSMDPRVRNLSRKSRDSRYREHAIYSGLQIPLKGIMSRVTLDGDVSYSYRDHLNRQSGLLYSSVRRRFMKAYLLTLGGKLNVLLWEPAGLTFALGISETSSRSHARELTYVETRYYGQLSAYY